MAETAKSTLSPELEQLRLDMIAAIDQSLALVTHHWTIRELRIVIGADGRVDPSPLLRRRPRRNGPTSVTHKISLDVNQSRPWGDGGGKDLMH